MAVQYKEIKVQKALNRLRRKIPYNRVNALRKKHGLSASYTAPLKKKLGSNYAE